MFLFFLFFFSPPLLAGEEALVEEQKKVPSDRFELVGDVLYDKKTGLRWLRCGVGSDIDKGVCGGSPFLVGYAEAERIVGGLSIGGLNDWRIPTLAEIEEISEKPDSPDDSWLSHAPFSNVPRGFYWSSTQSDVYHRQYWAFDIGDGSSGYFIDTTKFFIVTVHY